MPRGQPGRMRENEYRRQLEDTQPLIQQYEGGYLSPASVYHRVVDLKEPINRYSMFEEDQGIDSDYARERVHNVFGKVINNPIYRPVSDFIRI